MKLKRILNWGLMFLLLTAPILALDYSAMVTESKDVVDGASESIAPFMVMFFVWTPVVFFFLAIGIAFWMYSKKEDDRKNPTSSLVWGALISIIIYFVFALLFRFVLYKLTGVDDAYENMVTNYFSTMFADYI